MKKSIYTGLMLLLVAAIFIGCSSPAASDDEIRIGVNYSCPEVLPVMDRARWMVLSGYQTG